MMQRVGSCSLCGGSVMGVRGGWWSIDPPPPDTCESCGAKRSDDVIEMRPALPRRMPEMQKTGSTDTHEIERFWRGDGWTGR